MKNQILILTVSLLSFNFAIADQVCANNRAEVEASTEIMKKIEENGTSINKIFSQWIDTEKGVMLDIQDSGQFAIKYGEMEVHKDQGQVCLDEVGKLVLKAGEDNIEFPNFNENSTVKYSLQMNVVQEDGSTLTQSIDFNFQPESSEQ